MATPKSSITATDQASHQAFFENEHPTYEDLNAIPEQAYDYVAQLIWNALSDRNGVLSGLACTFAGGDAIVTVGDGSLIMQGNQAQHASATYTHTGANGTWYLYARPQSEADSTSTEDRSFVVRNAPRKYQGVSPASGETPDGSKTRFKLRHYRVTHEDFQAQVDGVAVNCVVSSGTGTGGYDEAVFATAPASATTVTFDYSQETGGYGRNQAVDVQNVVDLEFSSQLDPAGQPPQAGYVCLCQYTVAGGFVTAVDESYKEWLFYYDTAFDTVGTNEGNSPVWPKKVADLIYDLERGYVALSRLASRYMTSLRHEGDQLAIAATPSYGADTNLWQITNAADYANLRAGMVIYYPAGTNTNRTVLLQKEDDTNKVVRMEDAVVGGPADFDAVHELGDVANPYTTARIVSIITSSLLCGTVKANTSVETPLIKDDDSIEIRVDADADSGAQEFKVTHDAGVDPADVLFRVSEDGTVDVPTKLTVPAPASATEASRHDHDHLGDTGSGGVDILHPLAAMTRGFFALTATDPAPNETDFPYEVDWSAVSGAVPGVIAITDHIYALGDETDSVVFEYLRVRIRKGVRYIKVFIHASFTKDLGGSNLDLYCKIGSVNDPSNEATWINTQKLNWDDTTNAGWYSFANLDLGAGGVGADGNYVILLGVARDSNSGTNGTFRYAGSSAYEVIT